jgi:hypothetical protein
MIAVPLRRDSGPWPLGVTTTDNFGELFKKESDRSMKI